MVYRERVSQPHSYLPVQRNGIYANFERIKQGNLYSNKNFFITIIIYYSTLSSDAMNI
uniref:Uncharacterized protein n=1 Tax=Arundo donax TaxID=35708 RepID=A0A0A8YMC0_ARUDO